MSKCRTCCGCGGKSGLKGVLAHKSPGCYRNQKRPLYIILLCRNCSNIGGVRKTRALVVDPMLKLGLRWDGACACTKDSSVKSSLSKRSKPKPKPKPKKKRKRKRNIIEEFNDLNGKPSKRRKPNPPSIRKRKAAKHAILVAQSLTSGGNHDKINRAKRDVKAIHEQLKQYDYEITSRENQSKDQFKQFIRNSVNEFNGNDKVVFYYSGHGKQKHGIARLGCHGGDVSVRWIIRQFRKKKCQYVLLFDCCLDSKEDTWKSLGAEEEDLSKNSRKGEVVQFMMGYATLPGKGAKWGEQKSTSKYTSSLVQTLKEYRKIKETSGREIRVYDVLKRAQIVLSNDHKHQGHIVDASSEVLFL